MRFHCCPPEKKGALATPKKGGTVGRSSGAGKGLRGSKGKAKSKNPMADVECEDEIEEEKNILKFTSTELLPNTEQAMLKKQKIQEQKCHVLHMSYQH